MDFMIPPLFDILDFQNWKVKMSMYLKTPDIHVYFALLRTHIFINDKHLEANTKAIHALTSTLNEEYLSRVFNLDLTFIVWNTLCSLREPTPNKKESDSDEESLLPTCATWSKGMTPLR